MSADRTIISLADSHEEKREVGELVYDVYIEELGYTDVVDHDTRILLDELDDTAIHYAVRDSSSNLIGTYRINRFCDLRDPLAQLAPAPVEDLLQRAPLEALSYTSRVIIRKEWRGSTLLAKMAMHFASELLRLGSRFDICISLPHLVGFYEHLGYQRFGQRVTGEGYGIGFPMVMCTSDKQHFSQVRSPLIRHREIKSITDRWGDGRWLRERSVHWGVNHRVMERNAFWTIVGDALNGTGKTSGVFHGFSEEEAKQLLKTAPLLEIKKGDPILAARLHQENLYIIVEGEFTMENEEEVKHKPTTRLRAGDYFGEQEFLKPGLSKINVTASTDAKIMILDQVFLQKMRSNSAEALAIICRNLREK